jgi:pimeloyl-ACP methyl ester carboxylesterase
MRLERTTLGEPFAGLGLAHVEWGDLQAERVVFCVHGLTRNARDFDALATELAARGARVLALDVAGRGRSDWLPEPRHYDVSLYAAQVAALLRRLGLARVDWVGTSMGGLIGITLAGQDDPPIARLVLNDIGAFVPASALAPIKAYLGLDLRFASLDELEQHLRLIHAGFGDLSDEQWRHLARHSARPDGDGYRMHYDPQIKMPFAEGEAADIDLWDVWERIRCPCLLLRGGESQILPADVAQAMTRRGPGAELVTFEGVGHAPALMDNGQIGTVARWLGLSGAGSAG